MKRISTLKTPRSFFTIMMVLGLIGFLFPLKFYGQHEALFDRTWYLNKLEIEDTIYDYLVLVIENGDEARIEMNWSEVDHQGIINHNGCPGWGCLGFFEFIGDTNQILLNDGGCLTHSPCDIYQVYGDQTVQFNEFSDKHANFLFDRDDILLDYEIQHIDQIDYLIFTDENGDKVYYTSENLSTPTHKELTFSLTPNPVRDQLLLRLDDLPGVMKVEIVDLQGRKMQQLEVYNIETQLDVSRYSSGIYFIKVSSSQGKYRTLKFVKE